eukprot:GHVH01003381.1.p1 GENE.GHVH01003381.1~~GHVH01003381.1.p1  ORF type:complete len:456 (-),score=54.68 GHVH01003381.1:32-1399(-)
MNEASEWPRPLLPSPNLFSVLTNPPLDWSEREFGERIEYCVSLLNSMLPPSVEVASLLLPDRVSSTFFNVSLRCRGVDCGPLGASRGGCAGCSRNRAEGCPAQFATLRLLGCRSLEGVKLTASLSILDGISAMTALYASIVSGGGVQLASDSPIGRPQATRVIDGGHCTLPGSLSHTPEDTDATMDVELPPSLLLEEEYVTEREERELIHLLDSTPRSSGALLRRVVHYGYAFDYHIQQINPDIKLTMPPVIEALAERLYREGKVPELPDQVTINEYTPGQGIGFHIDVHSTFTSWIASLSLASASVMEFRRLREEGSNVRATRSTLQDRGVLPPPGVPSFFVKPDIVCRKLVQLKRRSLAVFSDELRYAYQHSIPSRKSDSVGGAILPRKTRVSITFRKIRDPRSSECPCKVPYYCDQKNPETYLNLLPTRLEGSPSGGAEKIKLALNNSLVSL